MRWLNARLIVGLAPLLSLCDAVDGAPAGALVAGAHRRAPVENSDSPWHRRYAGSRRQVDINVDVNVDIPNVDIPVVPAASGPPSTITVTDPAPTDPVVNDPVVNDPAVNDPAANDPAATDPAATQPAATEPAATDPAATEPAPTEPAPTEPAPTEPAATEPAPTEPAATDPTSTSTSTSSSDSSTSTSTSSSTDPTIASPDPSTSSDPLLNLSLSLSISLPLPTEDPTSTSNTPAPTDPPSTSDSSTSAAPTDPPFISISISVPPIFDPGNSTSDTTPPYTPPADPSTSNTADPPSSVSLTISDPPQQTPDPPISTVSSSSNSVILSLTDIFPSQSVSGVGSISTEVDPVTSRSISIETQYDFITATNFLIAPTSSTALPSVTNTDPDAVLTSNSLQAAGPSATVTGAAIPSTIPLFIAPPTSSDHVEPHTTMEGYTEISILFQMTARWMWILQNSETAAQILAYMRPIIVNSLGSLGASDEDVKTIGLSAFEPADTSSADDLMTMWVGLIKTEYVSPLAAMIKATPTSEFYNTGGPVAQSIAKNVVAAYNIATLTGVSNQDGSSSTSNSGQTVVDNSRRNAIIGVSVAFGLIALIVFVWWIVRTYKARREGMHKRLSYDGAPNYGAAGAGIAAGTGYGGGYGGGYGAGGIRAESPPALHNPFMTEREREDEARGIRRNSFYAIGPDDASIEEETFDYMSQRSSTGAGGPPALNRAGSAGSGGGGRWVGNGGLTVPGNSGAVRRPVVGQQISQPILRESSMGNW